MKNEGHGYYYDETGALLHDLTERAETKANATTERVNHPSYYSQGGIEVIEMMRRIWGEDNLVTFCQMNAFKYRMRAGHKDDAAQDLAKAQWYETELQKYVKNKG